MLGLAALGPAWGCLTTHRRAFLWGLLLWLPIPFYAYSIAFGSVPIFLPVWWPHSWYNTRYGMEMLPAFALGLGFVAQFVIAVAGEFKQSFARFAAGALYALVAINAWAVLRDDPLTYVEGTKNIDSRRTFEKEIPPVLRSLLATRPDGIVLMETSVYPNLVAFTRHSTAPDHQRERQGILFGRAWLRLRLTRPSCWRLTATRSTRRQGSS